MAEFPFNAAEVPENEGFKPIPPGTYLCQVISSEIKSTKKGDGTILKLTSQVLEGDYTGRLIFDNLNISNPNQDAERISQRTLADLVLACGMTVMKNTEELHFKPFIGRVGIREDKNGAYPPQNTIRYSPRQEQMAHQPMIHPVRQPADLNAHENRDHPTVVSKPSNIKPWQKPQARF